MAVSSVHIQREAEVANKLASVNSNEVKRGSSSGALQSRYGRTVFHWTEPEKLKNTVAESIKGAYEKKKKRKKKRGFCSRSTVVFCPITCAYVNYLAEGNLLGQGEIERSESDILTKT